MAATQSSTYSNDADQFGAGKCIDGNTGSDLGPDGRYAICHTNHDTAPWLAIDYGTSVTVQRVEIFNRGTNGQRTQNIEVRISNKLPASGTRMFSDGALLGFFGGPATNGQHITISGPKQL